MKDDVNYEEDFFIEFFTEHGGLDAIRIRIDMVRIPESDMNQPLKIDLINHPLYSSLKKYVEAN